MNDFLTWSRMAFQRAYGLHVDTDIAVNSSSMDSWFEMAHRHRVTGLWAAGLPACAPELHRAACGQMVHATRLTAEAERIVETLQSSLGQLRIVKGPGLAAQAWPELGLRSFDDLDFRCQKEGLPALTDGLRALGYQPQIKEPRHRENLWHFGWGVGFTNSDGFMVEFNHRMFPRHYPWPRHLTHPSSKHWKKQRLDQRSVTSPDPALHLLLCCSHILWHGWERLSWVVDIAGLLVRFPYVFAEADRLAAHDSFLRRSLHLGCCVAHRVFGPFTCSEPFSHISPEWVDLACRLLSQDSMDGSFEFQRKIHRQLMTPMESARYTVLRILTPGDPDFIRWSLPTPLRGLYWPLRPLRYLCERIPWKKFSSPTR
jgi:hypothetical protein